MSRQPAMPARRRSNASWPQMLCRDRRRSTKSVPDCPFLQHGIVAAGTEAGEGGSAFLYVGGSQLLRDRGWHWQDDAVRDEIISHFALPLEFRQMERCLAVLCLRIHIRAGLDQCLHAIEATGSGGDVEGVFAVALRIWICAPPQQQIDQIDPAFCQSRHKGRTQTRRRGGVDISTAFDEQFCRRPPLTAR